MEIKVFSILAMACLTAGMSDERNICGKAGQQAIRFAMNNKGYLCDDAERSYEMMNTTVTMPKFQNISHMVTCYMISKDIAQKGQVSTWPKVLISLGSNYSIVFSASDTYPHYMDPQMDVHYSKIDPEERRENAKELNAVVSYRQLANSWNVLGRRSKLITPMSRKEWSKWSLKLTLRLEQLLPITSCDSIVDNKQLSNAITSLYSVFWEEWRDLYSFIGFHQQSTQMCFSKSYSKSLNPPSFEAPTSYVKNFPKLNSEYSDPKKYFLPIGVMKSLDDITFGKKPKIEKNSETEKSNDISNDEL